VRATRSTLLTAVYRQLIATPSVVSRVGNYGPTPWIYQWDEHADIRGTGESQIVLRIPGSWATPNTHNTATFPRLSIETLTDTTRNSEKLPLSWTAENAAEELHEEIRKVLHRPAGEIRWGGFEIVASRALTEPAPEKVPGKDGLVSAICEYGVSL
jgi:hypothetical protein